MTIGSEDTSHQRVSSVHNKWGSTSRWPGTAPGVPVHSDFGSTFLGFGDPNPGCSLGATNGTNRNAGEVELDWLETFLAVVDRGGFTVASAHVHRSQPRVSAHIAALERELGVRLIDRSHRPAAVTSAGRLFAAHARQILAEVGSARSAISAMSKSDDETLAVLTIPCIGSTLFPGVFAETLLRQPGARFALSERGFRGGEAGDAAEEFALAVLPTLALPIHQGSGSGCSGQSRSRSWSRRITSWRGSRRRSPWTGSSAIHW